jgi:N-acetylglucosaminyl-diphospho-decaprenol L-rhamnosyltransferase
MRPENVDGGAAATSTEQVLPHVDAVVTAYAEPTESIRRTVEGLLRQGTLVARIFVVDDASPRALALPADLTPHVQLLRMRANSGIAAARNWAAAQSTADYLLFVNCDVALRVNAVQSALALMQAHPSAGVVGGPVSPVVGPDLLRRWRLRFLENPEQRSGEACRVTWVTAHAMLVRRAAFDAVGGFDARFRITTEDFDFCRRVSGNGWEVHHLPTFAADSFEVPSIDLFARKSLRGWGWDARGEGHTTSVGAAAIRPIQLRKATLSVLKGSTITIGRDVVKRRFAFLPIDVAVAGRSLFLVWSVWLRNRRAGLSSNPFAAKRGLDVRDEVQHP